MHEMSIETLWEAHGARKKLWVFCRNCGKAKLISPFSLIQKTRDADSRKLWMVAKRLKCRSCNLHAAVLIVAEGLRHDYRGECR